MEERYREHIVMPAVGNVPVVEQVKNEHRILKASIVGQLELMDHRLRRDNHWFRLEMRLYMLGILAIFVALLLATPQFPARRHTNKPSAKHVDVSNHHQDKATQMNTTKGYEQIHITNTCISNSDLIKKRWVQADKTKLAEKCSPRALRAIHGRLWCCCFEGGIIIYDSELQVYRSIQHGDISNAYDVAAMSNGDVLIAAYNGLFHLKVRGMTLSSNSIAILLTLLSSKCATITVHVY